MIRLFTLGAPARSGTMWCSRLFTTEYTYCYHELTTLLRPYPSNVVLTEWFRAHVADHDFELAQRRWLLQCYPEYFARLWERENFGQYVVGNSDNFVLEFLPALWLLWPDMRFIFSKRNGINCVQSHFIGRGLFPQVVLRGHEKSFMTNDFFTLCCHLWAEQVDLLERSKRWLQDKAECIETGLEKLTSDIEEVKRVWNWVGCGAWNLERITQMMGTPVNARTNTTSVAGWEEIWEEWTEDQRERFRSICGDAQLRFGYCLPQPSAR